jgi:hypothetical protein
MRKFWRNNGLSVVFLILFFFCLFGQYISGWKEYNAQREEEGLSSINIGQYARSGHFLQATFENWESEFLQMALFVVLTVSLRQKGSSESKGFESEPVDRKPRKRKDAPWPVKKGGLVLALYKRSLSIVLFILFLLSFALHLYGSLKDENEHLQAMGKPPETLVSYLDSNRFWFESFQNWQSEFLSVFTLVILSIFLRQQGSPQSKPVDAPHSETGE